MADRKPVLVMQDTWLRWTKAFEEHTVWVALLDNPTDKALLELTPRKHIDLRTQIY
jgi:hypothetical protein